MPESGQSYFWEFDALVILERRSFHGKKARPARPGPPQMDQRRMGIRLTRMVSSLSLGNLSRKRNKER